MPSKPELYVGNDNLIELGSLVTADDGVTVSGATVSATLKHTDGTEVAGQTWPETMAEASSGNYEGLVRDTAVLKAGEEYRLEIIADDGVDKRGQWVIPVRAVYRIS